MEWNISDLCGVGERMSAVIVRFRKLTSGIGQGGRREGFSFDTRFRAAPPRSDKELSTYQQPATLELPAHLPVVLQLLRQETAMRD